MEHVRAPTCPTNGWSLHIERRLWFWKMDRLASLYASTRSCPDENTDLSSHQTQQRLALVNSTTQQEWGVLLFSMQVNLWSTLAQAALISRRYHVPPSLISHKSHRLASALWSHNLIFSQIRQGPLITPTILSGQTIAASGDIPPSLANGVLSRLSVRRGVLLESDRLHCLVQPPHEDPPNPTRSQGKVHFEVLAGFTVRSLSFFLSVRRPYVSLSSLRLATAWSNQA